MLISAIVAKSTNNVIGQAGRLPFYLPADLKYFKEKTLNHHVIMGRKTFSCVGKVLPQRTNIVLTTAKISVELDNFYIVNSLQKGIEIAEKNKENELFIIGGEQIYTLAMPILNRLYVTEVHTIIEGGDSFFVINRDIWKEINRVENLQDSKNIYNFDFVIYERK